MTINKGLLHFDLRKRIYQKLEPFPHPDKFRRFYDILIYAIVFLAPIINIPQLLNIFLTKDATGVSLVSWVGFSCLSLVWLGYGILHRDKPIVYTNFGLIIIQLMIVVGIILYG